MRWILLLFVVVPLVELYLLLWIDSLIGFWPTLGIVLFTGIVGGSLAKREGLKVWRQWRQALGELRPPERGVVDGVLVLVGGALLITPGVLTDVVGLLFLFGPTRARFAAHLRRAIDRRIQAGQIRVVQSSFGANQWPEGAAPFDVPEPPVHDADVVETTAEEVEERGERQLPPPRD